MPYISISFTEKRFLEYCRRIKFGKIEVEVMNGEPKIGERPLERVRFDLTESDDAGMMDSEKSNKSTT